MTVKLFVRQFAFVMVSAYLAAAPQMADASIAASIQPKIVVHGSADVASDYFTLGDIADITPAPGNSKASALLAATVVGRAALPGSTRLVNKGDILLKLREAGIDPATVDIEGATSVYVTSTGSARSGSPGSYGSSSALPKLQPIAVKAGAAVDVVLIDGPVSVRAKATAVSSGAVGDVIDVRRDGSLHNLDAIIIDATTVQLEE